MTDKHQHLGSWIGAECSTEQYLEVVISSLVRKGRLPLWPTCRTTAEKWRLLLEDGDMFGWINMDNRRHLIAMSTSRCAARRMLGSFGAIGDKDWDGFGDSQEFSESRAMDGIDGSINNPGQPQNQYTDLRAPLRDCSQPRLMHCLHYR